MNRGSSFRQLPVLDLLAQHLVLRDLVVVVLIPDEHRQTGLLRQLPGIVKA